VSRIASLAIAAALLAGMTGAVLATAQSQQPEDRRHLLVVPSEARAESALADSDARVVARYDDFTLVEAIGDDERRLRSVGATRRDDMRKVELGGGAIDPLNRESLAAKGADRPAEELVLVQFVGPAKDAWLERLNATGGRVVGYAAQNSYLVHASGPVIDRLLGLVGTDSSVRAVMPVRPSDKFVGNATGGPVTIETVSGDAGQNARALARSLGPTLRAGSEVVGVTTQIVRLDRHEVLDLASDPGVLSVEPYSEPELMDERASQIVAGNLIAGMQAQPGYLSWLAAEGSPSSTFDFAIDVTDEGFDNGSAAAPAHADFYEDGDPLGTSRVRYVTDYTPDANGLDCGGHGTNVASIAAGYNDQPNDVNNDDTGFNHGLGIAPRAQVGVSKIFACNQEFDLGPNGSFTSITSSAHANGARISNNSWGFSATTSRLGQYHSSSREYDALVRDARPSVPGNQQMVEIFAAGNNGQDAPEDLKEGYGSVTPPGTGKNVITVGASENLRPLGFTDGCGVPDLGADQEDDIIDFSGRGPTDDLRVKPDLVAPGTHMLGARPTHPAYGGFRACSGQSIFPTGTFYNLISGTSQAAPVVAGAAALIRDWYIREHGGPPPSPAMTKAILTNTAADVAGGDDGKGSGVSAPPSMDAGWGRVNLAGVFGGPAREYVDQTQLLDESGDTFEHSYEIPAAGQPVKVTLAWTDAVPAASGGNAFVNDLDLEVTAGGRRHLGNVLSGGLSIPGGNPDTRNNLETVVLRAGLAAKINVKVRGTTIAGNGVPGNGLSTDQDFALVVSNATEVHSAVLAGESTTLTDTAPDGDGDGALEPGETFSLEQKVRNDGESDATGVAGTISADPPMSFSPAVSGYPDILAGTATANSTPYVGQLEATASCGADIDATLSVATDQGTEAIPIVIPTGAQGAPDPQAVTHSPALGIPDDSSLGVTSTLSIASPGHIKDLDVRIGRISHGFVGDLAIDLSGPDGTTVTLAHHPGGPDNGGNNLVETVFDDEAPTHILSGSAPYTGRFRPQRDQLSRFDGKNKQGNWQLRVRDLSEGDVGGLVSWGTQTRSAVCNPPQTVITAGPAEGAVLNSTTARFEFSSAMGADSFECRLDGQPFQPCASPKDYVNLGQGAHSFEVRGLNADGDADQTPAVRTWTVDTVGPAATIDTPGQGTTVPSQRTTLGGAVGTAPRDLPGVAARIHGGTSTAGPVIQTLSPTVSGSRWSAPTAADLPEGTYTAYVEQSDSLGNKGTSTSTFIVDVPDPPPPAKQGPSFVLAPAEERIADALAGRLTVVAGCASACRVDARLTASSRTARTLGLGAKSTVLGKGSKRRAAAGTATATVRLNKQARAALRRKARANVSLRLKVTDGGRTLPLNQTISLRRSAGLRRVASQGLRLWAVCSERCPLNGSLTLSAKEARRIGLRPRGSRRMQVAEGRVTAPAGRPARLTLKVRRGAKKAMSKARRLSALLEATAGAAPNPVTAVKRAVTLRR
jgi:subtilisin-like proprotein convertase family protein